jgi:hypothetical protein
MTGFAAAFAESPVDFYKSQVQVQVSMHSVIMFTLTTHLMVLPGFELSRLVP